MSYEGSVEYLCARGHRSVADCREDLLTLCRCGEPMKFWHAIDSTNGEDPNDPSTFPAARVQIGFDDIWKTDHHGNRYAIKDTRYAALGGWRECADSAS